MQDIIISDFKRLDIENLTRMPLIVIYKDTSDYPSKYVARLWDIDNPTSYVVIDDDICRIRTSIPAFMVRLEPSANDDKVIVETWI